MYECSWGCQFVVLVFVKLLQSTMKHISWHRPMSLSFHLTKCDVFYIWYGKKDNESWDAARKTKGFENKKSAQIYVPFGRCIKKIKYGLVWSSPWQDISREYRHHTSSFLIAEINRNTHPSTRTVNAIAHNCAPKAHSDASVCDKIYVGCFFLEKYSFDYYCHGAYY